MRSTVWRRLLTLGLLGLTNLFAGVATAQSARPRVHLSWVRDAEAADACPDVTQVEADVAARLGFSPFTNGDRPSASIEVLVTRNKSVWQAAAQMRDADGSLRGSRQVESSAPDCHSLGSAAALALALMIDPELLLRPPPVAPASPPKSTTPAPPPAAPAPPLPPPARRGPRGALAVGATVAGGVLPSAAVGPELSGELSLAEHLALAVDARYFPEQHVQRAGAEAFVGLTLGSLGPCYRVELGERWAITSCGSVLLGSLAVAVSTPSPVQVGARPWLGAACGLRLGFRYAAFELGVSGAALAHFARHSYTVSRLDPARTETLFTEPAAGVLGSLTTGVRF